MPWLAPAVAFIDAAGHLRCPACRWDDGRAVTPVWGDAADDGETCDRCQAPILPTTQRVYVAGFDHAARC
jgi:hypothetical protein